MEIRRISLALQGGGGRGGCDEAKRALDVFWADISQAAQAGPLQ